MINGAVELPESAFPSKRSTREPEEISSACLVISRVFDGYCGWGSSDEYSRDALSGLVLYIQTEIHEAGQGTNDRGTNEAADDSKNSDTQGWWESARQTCSVKTKGWFFVRVSYE